MARLGVVVGGFLLALRVALPTDGPGLGEALAASRQASLLATLGALAASFGILGAGWWPLFRAYVVASFFNLVLPGAVLGDVHRVWDARDTAGGAPAALGIARCILFRLLSQVTLVAAVFVHSLTLDSAVAWYWFFVVPFITLVSLIPVSIGGAGVREYLYMTLFGTALAALGLSPAVFAVSIAWGLAGLGLFLRDRRAGAKTAG